ncbi:MAG: hypothetical protein Q4B94_00775 [Pseudomonadota bacterium]|nr:hypothetical protein [Pseudomonadota bacterium]
MIYLSIIGTPDGYKGFNLQRTPEGSLRISELPSESETTLALGHELHFDGQQRIYTFQASAAKSRQPAFFQYGLLQPAIGFSDRSGQYLGVSLRSNAAFNPSSTYELLGELLDVLAKQLLPDGTRFQPGQFNSNILGQAAAAFFSKLETLTRLSGKPATGISPTISGQWAIPLPEINTDTLSHALGKYCFHPETGWRNGRFAFITKRHQLAGLWQLVQPAGSQNLEPPPKQDTKKTSASKQDNKTPEQPYPPKVTGSKQTPEYPQPPYRETPAGNGRAASSPDLYGKAAPDTMPPSHLGQPTSGKAIRQPGFDNTGESPIWPEITESSRHTAASKRPFPYQWLVLGGIAIASLAVIALLIIKPGPEDTPTNPDETTEETPPKNTVINADSNTLELEEKIIELRDIAEQKANEAQTAFEKAKNSKTLEEASKAADEAQAAAQAAKTANDTAHKIHEHIQLELNTTKNAAQKAEENAKKAAEFANEKATPAKRGEPKSRNRNREENSSTSNKQTFSPIAPVELSTTRLEAAKQETNANKRTK